jgi:tellurite resistance protein TerC
VLSIFHQVIASIPTWHEVVTNLPVIMIILFIDGLLSFDNALVLATMVRHLPDAKQKFALRAGLLGAFVMRGTSLCLVAYFIANPWIKLVGGLYLLYLMCSNLGQEEGGDEDNSRAKVRGLLATIIAVELADMAFSMDNIVATAAMSTKMWVVCGGVFASIVIMRFVAGVFIGLVKKFPILEKVSYVLVGFIGLQLIADYFFHIELTDMEKFAGVVGIAALGIIYERAKFLHPVFDPVFNRLGQAMGFVSGLVDSATGSVKSLFSKKAN